MAKTTKKSKTKAHAKRVISRVEPSLLGSTKGVWGKDQPMVLILSSGIIILIVVTLFLTGWL